MPETTTSASVSAPNNKPAVPDPVSKSVIPKDSKQESAPETAISEDSKQESASEPVISDDSKQESISESVISDDSKQEPAKKRKKHKKNKKPASEGSTEENIESPQNETDSATPKAIEKADKKPEHTLDSSSNKSPRTLNDGLKTTRSQGFLARIGQIFKGQMSPSVEEELEDILFQADIGVQTSERLLERVTNNLRDKGDGNAAMDLLKDEISSILKVCEKPFVIGNEKPHVILTLGVNGAGKTTTLGKLAAQLTAKGKKVLLIAGDTFRAAAIEQLEEWAQRCGCEFFSKKQGADPAGTIFDGIRYAMENGFDVALADTAGRLHNKKELIDELKKIHRVAGKAMSGAPHQVLLVLDATNGQNALMQAKEFGEAIDFDGIALTKLDGTAKGGVIIGICEEFKKPVYFIGIGEMIDDLRPFNADEFLEALFLED